MNYVMLLFLIVFAVLWVHDGMKAHKYLHLWQAEAERHAHARTELAEMDRTAHLMGDCCATHVRTIAKLKQEVAQLHEEIAKKDELRERLARSLAMRINPPEEFPAFDGIKVEEVEDMAMTDYIFTKGNPVVCQCGGIATMKHTVTGKPYCESCRPNH